MEKKIVKPCDGLSLKQIGDQYIIVKTDAGSANMSRVYILNEVAAAIWQRMTEVEATPEMLAEWICSQYDVDEKKALEDVNRQLEEWKSFGLLA